jgi:hypothetical protein
MDTQIIDGMSTLTLWKMWNYRMCISKQIRNVVRKWAKDKQNEGVLGWVNNQAPATRPTQEWRCAHITCERKFVRSELNSWLCN